MSHGASGNTTTKRGPPPTPGAAPHADKRWAQAVAAPVGHGGGKKQRVGHGRDMPAPRAGHVASGEGVDDGRASAVQLVASEAGVDAVTVERDHRELEDKSERPVRATVEGAVATAPAPLGAGHAQAEAKVVPIHPALPFGATERRGSSGRWREGSAAAAAAPAADDKPPRGMKRNRDRKDRKLIERAIARSSGKQLPSPLQA